MEWNDATSYARGQRGIAEPNTLETRVGPVTLTVHRFHGLQGWFASTRPVIFDRKPLDSTDLENAKQEAVAGLGAWAASVTEAIR
jgi:hypothetical protein